ncbi:ABC transporter permease [Paradesulfitobacterium ferrireducens]|uniref:ABC transporter permease n=1 Tax=Paradesulfitobacterium ferrireducens TaxID=2816476 RepID=UPI001A8C9246|nr:ABC transporter permease [Paradesulfitobacterium ferrireducens]
MHAKLKDLLITNILAIVLGIIASGLMLLFLGKNPVSAYAVLITSVVRDGYTFADIFVKATPLMFTALAFAFTYKANLYNIGAQGQFYIGAVIAAAGSLFFQNILPSGLALIITLLLTIVGGGLWGAFIGFVKARYNSNEFLVSMMSTYVALAIMNYLLRTFLMETKGEYPQTDALAASVWLPRIIPGTRLHIGFVLAVLACIGVWILLYKTPLGYRIRAVGYNSRAASMSGINAKKLYVLAFFISGALAGAAGFTEVNGVQHMLVQGFNSDIGAAGIGIAILANGSPIGIIFAATLFGALKVGGTIMGQMSGIPSSIIELMQGFVMVFVILAYFVRTRLENNREKRKLQKAAV